MKIGLTYNVRSGMSQNGTSPWLDEEEEFDSPETIAAVADAIRALGHEIELLGEGEPLVRRLLEGARPDMVFNFAEGRGVGRCREARVPAVLEMFGIPYTGSDPLTLSVALDKDCAKRLVAAAGVPTPRWVIVGEDAQSAKEGSAFCLAEPGLSDLRIPTAELLGLSLPVIVKPAFEGSSKGILTANLIHSRERLLETVAELYSTYRQPILVEEFIHGAELTVGMLGNAPAEVVGIMRVVPFDTQSPFVYSLEVKRDWKRRVRYECPAQLSEAEAAAVAGAALKAWKALGCQDVARIDFRLRDGVPYFLEANPLPGLSPESGDLVLLARGMGIEHQELIGRILNAAGARTAANNTTQANALL